MNSYLWGAARKQLENTRLHLHPTLTLILSKPFTEPFTSPFSKPSSNPSANPSTSPSTTWSSYTGTKILKILDVVPSSGKRISDAVRGDARIYSRPNNSSDHPSGRRSLGSGCTCLGNRLDQALHPTNSLPPFTHTGSSTSTRLRPTIWSWRGYTETDTRSRSRTFHKVRLKATDRHRKHICDAVYAEEIRRPMGKISPNAFDDIYMGTFSNSQSRVYKPRHRRVEVHTNVNVLDVMKATHHLRHLGPNPATTTRRMTLVDANQKHVGIGPMTPSLSYLSSY